MWPVLFGVGVLAGVTAAGLGALSLADALTATGLPDPGPVTTYGLPFVRAAGEIAARAWPSGRSCSRRSWCRRSRTACSTPTDTGHCALGTVASGVWTVCAALLVPLTVSDVTGQPLRRRLSPSDIWSVASLVETAGAWRWTAFLAAVVTVASIPVLRWSWTPVLFAGSLVTLMPLALTGHSSVGRLARPGHQQPAHPPDRRRAVGRRPAGAAGPRAARRRARRPRRAAVLRRRAVVLRGDGAQRRRQRLGADPPDRSVRRRLRLAGHRQGRRRCARSASSGGGSGAAASPRCKPIRKPAAR